MARDIVDKSWLRGPRSPEDDRLGLSPGLLKQSNLLPRRSSRPVVMVGVKSPPAAPLPRHTADEIGLSSMAARASIDFCRTIMLPLRPRRVTARSCAICSKANRRSRSLYVTDEDGKLVGTILPFRERSPYPAQRITATAGDLVQPAQVLVSDLSEAATLAHIRKAATRELPVIDAESSRRIGVAHAR
jgi:hypothetical protein